MSMYNYKICAITKWTNIQKRN